MDTEPKDNSEDRPPQHRALTEIDIEALRINRGETIFKGCVDCVKMAIKWGSILGCAVCFYKSVQSFVTGVSNIADRTADVLTALCVRDIVYWFAILIFAGSGVLRKWRNRRLTKKDGELRHELEKSEKANTRSGLNPQGEALEDEE